MQLKLSLMLTTERHDSVMNDVQGWNLIVAFPHDEEECVEELCELANVIPPTSFCHLTKEKFKKADEILTWLELTFIAIAVVEVSTGWHL